MINRDQNPITSLGDCILEFFKFFGNNFDYKTQCISIGGEGEIRDKGEYGDDDNSFVIFSILNSNLNLGKSAFRYDVLLISKSKIWQECLKDDYRKLKDSMDNNRTFIVSSIILTDVILKVLDS